MLEAGFWGFVGGLALLVGALIGLKARAGPRTTERCWAPEYMLRCSPAASRSIPTSPPWRPTQRDDDRTALNATRSLVVVRRRKLWGWGYEDDGSSARQRGWFCFSCRRGTSIYDLAGPLLGFATRGRDFVELRRELGRRFGLDVDEGGPARGGRARLGPRSEVRRRSSTAREQPLGSCRRDRLGRAAVPTHP